MGETRFKSGLLDRLCALRRGWCGRRLGEMREGRDVGGQTRVDSIGLCGEGVAHFGCKF